jgi:putative transposase
MPYPRRIVPGTTYLLTRRCTQRRFMLVPRGIAPELFGDCVALAAERHGIEVPAVTVMANHDHALVTDRHGNIPEVCRDVHSLSARALNAHLGRWGALRWGALWSAQHLNLVERVDAPNDGPDPGSVHTPHLIDRPGPEQCRAASEHTPRPHCVI